MKMVLYPPGWKTVSEFVRFVRAGGRCECTGECGLHNRTRGPRRCEELAGQPAKWAKGKVMLTTAHLCKCEPLCATETHLKAMCNRCHLRVDQKQHTRNAATTRQKKQEAAGQWRLLLLLLLSLPAYADTQSQCCPAPLNHMTLIYPTPGSSFGAYWRCDYKPPACTAATPTPTRTPWPTLTPTLSQSTPVPTAAPSATPISTPAPTPSGVQTYNTITFSCAPPMAPCAPLVLRLVQGTGRLNVNLAAGP